MQPIEHTTTAKQDLEVFNNYISRQAPEVMKSYETILRLKDIYMKAMGEKDTAVEQKCRDKFQIICKKEV